MDIALLRTFLEVARTRHFGHAADNLFVTQSAVSARIKLLESTLGVDLFERRRNDIRLTAAGERLSRHAETIVRSWGRAKTEVALREGQSTGLSVGCVLDVWKAWAQPWVGRVKASHTDIALHLEVRDTHTLTRSVTDGTLDLALVLETPHATGLHVTPLADVTLYLYATSAGRRLEDVLDSSHISVDWGGNFRLASADGKALPTLSAGQTHVSQGQLALDLLCNGEGSAYLPGEVAGKCVEAGRLHRVEGAPEYSRQVFGLHRPENPNRTVIERVLGLF